MKRRELIKIAGYVGLGILVVLVLLTIMHFTTSKDDVVIDLNPDETVTPAPFLNLTDYSESYIRDLVMEKRDLLSKAFQETIVYKLKSDDEEEIAISEQFVELIRPIVSESLFEVLTGLLTPVDSSEVVDVSFPLYTVSEEDLNALFSHTAVAFENVDSYSLEVLKATDEMIESEITITTCEKVCDKKETYIFNLILNENAEWVIDEIE